MSKLPKKLVLITLIVLFASTFIYTSVGHAAENNEIKPTISYITESGPVERARAISQKGWSQSDNVIITSVLKFPDALAGSSLAIIKDSPILYVATTGLLDYTGESSNWEEILRLKAKRVYILGGTGVVAQKTEDDLRSKNLEVIRLSGDNRFETAKAIGDEIIKENNSNTVFIANANNFPDALAVATFAGELKSPILLTNKDSLDAIAQNALKEWSTKTVYIAGGTGAISQKVEDTLSSQSIKVIRLGGQNRYETAQRIIKNFKPNVDSMILTSGESFNDALVASVYGYKINHPVMLFNSGRVAESIKEFLWSSRNLLCVGTTPSEYSIRSLPPPISPGGFVNTSGGGDPRNAGVINTFDSKLVTVNRSSTYEGNFSKLNGMIGMTYGLTYVPWMTAYGQDNLNFATFKYDKDKNRYGVEIQSWRHSLNEFGVSRPLNAVLETFYFLSGDREVAYALWSWFDAKNIKGYANTDDFGFKDIEWTTNGGTISMNGIEIGVTHVNGVTTVYFNK